MPRAKRSLEEVDPNTQTTPNKSSKGNDGTRRSLRSSGKADDVETPKAIQKKNASDKAPNKTSSKKSTLKQNPEIAKKKTDNSKTTLAKGKSNNKGKAKPKDKEPAIEESDSVENSGEQSEDEVAISGAESNDEGEEVSPNKLPPFEYIVGQPPQWDWSDQHVGKNQDKADKAYEKLLKDMKPYMFKRLAKEPDSKWILMRGAIVRYVDAIYDSNKRDPDLLGMYIYNDFLGYGLHEVLENFLVDYHTEYTRKKDSRDLKAIALEFAFGHIDDAERVFSILGLIGKAFLPMLDVLEQKDQLKSDPEFKDLALIMAVYIIWAEEWDADTFNSSTQNWSVKILKYAQDHNIDLANTPPALAAKTIDSVKKRAAKQEAWPKPGPDRWGFQKAFNKHKGFYGAGGRKFDITNVSKAERIHHSFDDKDSFADIPAKALKDGSITIGTL